LNFIRQFGVVAAIGFWLSLHQVLAALPDPVRFGVAVELGDIGRAKDWLDQGLDPDFLADRIGSGLMIGAWEGNIAMMELFLSRGADLNRTNRIGEQALQLAAWKGHLEAVKWLLDHGAVLNRPRKQWGALHYAAFAGHKDIAQLLIDRGADIDARTPNDSTALMMTAREGHDELARMLMSAGADPKPVNDWGDSALTWAMRYHHLRIAQLVANSAEIAQVVKGAAETLDTTTRSVPAPPDLMELLRQMRLAQAEGRSADELHKAFFAALAAFKADSRPLDIKESAAPSPEPRGAPKMLVITATRQRPDAERVELVYEARKVAEPSKPMATDVAQILQQMRRAQSKGRPVDDLRKALYEAVSRFKNEIPPPAAENAK
jgi:uncharacterized protein